MNMSVSSRDHIYGTSTCPKRCSLNLRVDLLTGALDQDVITAV